MNDQPEQLRLEQQVVVDARDQLVLTPAEVAERRTAGHLDVISHLADVAVRLRARGGVG